jgi:hypothetical protein
MFKANTIRLRDGQPSFPLGTRATSAPVQIRERTINGACVRCMRVDSSPANATDANCAELTLLSRDNFR